MTKVIFFGSSKHSITVLEALYKNKEYRILAIVTQPDRSKGRKKILIPTEVRRFGENHRFAVLTPEKLEGNKEFINKIKQWQPDILVIADYGLLISKEILAIPNYGGLNLHPSLLPAYRGSSPAQWAILRGEKFSGLTIIKISPRFDEGKIVAQRQIEIADSETAESFYEKAFKLGAKLLLEILPDYLEGKITLKNQGSSPTPYAHRLSREAGRIDWKKSAPEIERVIRAFYPWPGCWTNLGELFEDYLKKPPATLRQYDERTLKKRVKILKANLRGERLVIETLQVEGNKPITWEEFARGYFGRA